MDSGLIKARKYSSQELNAKNKNSTLTDSYHFDRLYHGGLHAKSEIKNKWFNMVVKACHREKLLAIEKPRIPQNQLIPSEGAPDSESVSDGEEDRCWKRKKLSDSRHYFLR